jgi:hypothetical protein
VFEDVRKLLAERCLYMLATGEGGFHQVASLASLASLASERNPACPCGVPDKSLILSHNAEAIRGGGFQVASPVKKPRASEMPRCAPPHTNGAREEPCQGGHMAFRGSTFAESLISHATEGVECVA